MTAELKDNHVELYRYVRPYQFDETKMEVDYHPCGGITFKFIIDQDNEMLTFSWAIRQDDENFSYRIGKQVVEGRLAKYSQAAPSMSINYNREISLVDNVRKALDVWAANSIKTQPPSPVSELYYKLRQIDRTKVNAYRQLAEFKLKVESWVRKHYPEVKL